MNYFPGHLFRVRVYRFLAEAAVEQKLEQNGQSRSDSRSADQSPDEVAPGSQDFRDAILDQRCINYAL